MTVSTRRNLVFHTPSHEDGHNRFTGIVWESGQLGEQSYSKRRDNDNLSTSVCVTVRNSDKALGMIDFGMIFDQFCNLNTRLSHLEEKDS